MVTTIKCACGAEFEVEVSTDTQLLSTGKYVMLPRELTPTMKFDLNYHLGAEHAYGPHYVYDALIRAYAIDARTGNP